MTDTLTMKAYYVSPEGQDSNPGTLAHPFKTIQQAINQTAGENRTLYLRGGAYDISEGTHPSAQGPGGLFIAGSWNPQEAEAHLKIQPYENERPVLDGQNVAPGSIGIFLKDIQNVHIQGLEIHSLSAHGIEVVNGKHITILNNILHHNQGSGIGVRGYLSDIEANGATAQRSENIRIEGNQVYRNVLENSGENQGKRNWGAAVYTRHTAQVTIANNQVYENYGEGIAASQSLNTTIAGNVVYDNFSVNVYLDNVGNTTVHHNFIYTTDHEAFFREGREGAYPANNIGLANELYENVESPSLYYLNNNTIANNVLVGGSTSLYYGTYAGIHSSAPMSKQGLKNTRIVNNTFYNPQFSFIKLDADPLTENVEFFNSIFSRLQRDGRLTNIASPQGLTFTHNLWNGRDRASTEEHSIFSADDVTADPMLINPGGLHIEDYQLKPKSPAIDKARAVIGVTDNSVGPPDMGALEFGVMARLPESIPRAEPVSDPFLGFMLLLAAITLLKKG